MKKQIITLVITAFMTVIILTNCGEKSKQDAVEVKEDVIELNKDLTRGAIDTAEEISTALKQQWDTFKTVSEIAIENTEKEIKELREKISKKNNEERKKLTQKLDELEQKNIVLKDKLVVRTRKFKENMIEFDEKAKENEKAFEREFDRDIKALNTALKDFFKDNVD
jgi:NurA-like 5'-3' nuclease